MGGWAAGSWPWKPRFAGIFSFGPSLSVLLSHWLYVAAWHQCMFCFACLARAVPLRMAGPADEHYEYVEPTFRDLLDGFDPESLFLRHLRVLRRWNPSHLTWTELVRRARLRVMRHQRWLRRFYLDMRHGLHRQEAEEEACRIFPIPDHWLVGLAHAHRGWPFRAR